MNIICSLRVSRAAAVLAGIVTLAGGMSVASSDAHAYDERVRRACTGDYRRLCGQYKPHTPQLRSCMEANAFSISGPCVSALVDSGEVDGSKVRKRR
jgi:hypothetical protein